MAVMIVYGHLNGKDSVSCISGWGDAGNTPLHRSSIIFCLDLQFLPKTHPTENIVRGTKGYLYATDIGDRKSIGGRRHQASQIYIPAEDVSRERHLQVGVSKRQL